MSYIEKSLMAGEHVVYEAEVHPVVYRMPLLLAFIAIVQFVIPTEGTQLTMQIVFCIILLLVAGVMAIKAHGGKRFVLTNKRLIAKKGILRHESLDLMLRRCEGVQLSQGLLGRMMNYGTVVVTTGEAMNLFQHIKDPITFSTQINQQVELLMTENENAV